MLEKLPKIYFVILSLINIMFFSFIVYLTYFIRAVDPVVYLYCMIFYIAFLLAHALGAHMYEKTLEVLDDEYYLDVEEEYDELED